MEHRLLHESIAGTDRHAMPAGNAARFADGGAAVPQNSRMRIFPADGQSFVDLEILARFDAAAAQDALIGIVAVERIGVVDFVRLGFEWNALVLDGKHLGGVMNHAVTIVVVAYGAIQEVIAQNAIKRFRSCGLRAWRP